MKLARFDFVTGKRYFDDTPVTLEAGQPVVVEGLHALNDSLTYMLPRYEKVKISLGVLTQIRINDHNRISTSDTRIIRRMVRDQQFRDRGPMATMDIWADVRRGEEQNIYPIRKMPTRFSIRPCRMNCRSSSLMPNPCWNPSRRTASTMLKRSGY